MLKIIQRFTLEIGKTKLIDEAKIRKKAYADALIEVKRQYWAKDESLVYYNEEEKLAAEAHEKMQDAIIETAESIQSFADLSNAMIKANQEHALKVAADYTYKVFYPDIMVLKSIRMYRDAVVNEDPSIYPGHPDWYDDYMPRLEVDAPKNYRELNTLIQRDQELDYQEYRKQVEASYQSSAQEEYDYSKLWEPRNRRNYPVKDEVLTQWIEESKNIKEKELKGVSLCQ